MSATPPSRGLLLKPEWDWSLSNYSGSPPHFPLPPQSVCRLSLHCHSSFPYLLSVCQCLSSTTHFMAEKTFGRNPRRPPMSVLPQILEEHGTEMCVWCLESISGIPSKADFQDGSREWLRPTVWTQGSLDVLHSDESFIEYLRPKDCQPSAPALRPRLHLRILRKCWNIWTFNMSHWWKAMALRGHFLQRVTIEVPTVSPL